MIIARPLAGLANKLRVIESAVSLAFDLNCPTEIIWITDWQMVARYDELFEPSDLFTVTTRNKFKYCRSSFSMTGFKRPLTRAINHSLGIDLVFNETDIMRQVRPGHWDIRSLVRGKSRVYIDTCHNFYPYHYNFSWVKPLPVIADNIGKFRERINGRNCIGLHIRRTDNASSIECSPDELFEDAVRTELANDPQAVFFLATDNQATQSRFVDLFGSERIFVHPKRFGRDSVPAIQDAVVDWILLGACSKLYCSFYSSFSETAIAVSKAPAITLRRETQSQ